MNKSAFYFLGLISLAAGYAVESGSSCNDLSPEFYCALIEPTNECDRYKDTEFCKRYLSTPICDRGPQAYCTIQGADVECNAVDECLAWPDNGVVAVPATTTGLENLYRPKFLYGLWVG